MAKRKVHIPEEILAELNERQKLFADLYMLDKDCFGSATRSYMQAYNLKESQRSIAGPNGYKLLNNTHIKAYMSAFLKERFNDKAIDERHSQLVLQNKNLVVALGALQEYNKVKDRLSNKIEGEIRFKWAGNGKRPSNKQAASAAEALVTRPKPQKKPWKVNMKEK